MMCHSPAIFNDFVLQPVYHVHSGKKFDSLARIIQLYMIVKIKITNKTFNLSTAKTTPGKLLAPGLCELVNLTTPLARRQNGPDACGTSPWRAFLPACGVQVPVISGSDFSSRRQHRNRRQGRQPLESFSCLEYYWY